MISLGVVAHTTRSAPAKQLARTVRADFVSIDNGYLGCDQNHEAVQYHLSTLPSTFSVVLEDDAVPVAGFREQLAQALPMSPSPIVSLYLGRLRPPWAQDGIAAATEAADIENADWIVGTHLLHGVGYAIRTELLPSLLAFQSRWPVDQHISLWAQQYGHTIAYAWPSLVDHSDTPTVIGEHFDGQPRDPGRVAWRTGTHETWSTRSVTLRIP